MGTSIAAAAHARAERRVVRRLRAAGALSSETAVAIGYLRPLERRRLRRLVAGGSVHQRGEHYWLDEARYAERERDRRLTVAVLLVTLAAGTVVWLSVLR